MQATASLGVAEKATGGFEKKKKNLCARQKLEWLLPISSTGSRPSVEVVTGRQQVRRAGAATGAAAHTTAPARAHDLGNARAIWARQGEVATSFWRRDLDWRGVGVATSFLVSRLAEVRTEGSLVVT